MTSFAAQGKLAAKKLLFSYRIFAARNKMVMVQTENVLLKWPNHLNSFLFVPVR